MDNKCFVVLLGAGSSGKTTTRRSICGEPVRMDRVMIDDRPCFVTFYEKYAVAGNHNSGSDANASPRLIIESARRAFQERDVVFFDGVMGSPRLLEIPESIDCSVLLVHYNLSQDEINKRLMARRRANGKVEECLPEKTLKNSIAFSRRASNALKDFEERCTRRIMKIEIGDKASTEEIAEKIKKGIAECLCTQIAQSSNPGTPSKSSSGVRKIRLSKSRALQSTQDPA